MCIIKHLNLSDLADPFDSIGAILRLSFLMLLHIIQPGGRFIGRGKDENRILLSGWLLERYTKEGEREIGGERESERERDEVESGQANAGISWQSRFVDLANLDSCRVHNV